MRRSCSTPSRYRRCRRRTNLAQPWLPNSSMSRGSPIASISIGARHLKTSTTGARLDRSGRNCRRGGGGIGQHPSPHIRIGSSIFTWASRPGSPRPHRKSKARRLPKRSTRQSSVPSKRLNRQKDVGMKGATSRPDRSVRPACPDSRPPGRPWETRIFGTHAQRALRTQARPVQSSIGQVGRMPTCLRVSRATGQRRIPLDQVRCAPALHGFKPSPVPARRRPRVRGQGD